MERAGWVRYFFKIFGFDIIIKILDQTNMLIIIQIFLLLRNILMHLTFPGHARTRGEGGGGRWYVSANVTPNWANYFKIM